MDDIKELKTLLKAVTGIDFDEVQKLARKLDRMRLPKMKLDPIGMIGRDFNGCNACHSDDIALVILAFQKYGLKKGVHYDYGDDDGYHFAWCCNYIHPKTKDALRDIENYEQIISDSLKAVPYMAQK